MIDNQWEAASEGIGCPIRLRNGTYDGMVGIYWAWPVDGYFDLHFTDVGATPDGSEVVGEFYSTVKEARTEARELTNMERWTKWI
jgi:hypothetical protein